MKEYNRDQVKEIIATVIDKTETKSSRNPSIDHVRSELKQLATTIDKLHKEVVATRSRDVGGKQIPSMTDELDAVVGATEQASATIMDSCEAIQSAVDETSENDALKAKVFDQTAKVFEACSFQDITGQRIKKVVTTLQQVEESVDNLLNLFGDVDPSELGEVEDTRTEDEKLMEGPQLEGQGVSQDEIDKLLAAFD